MHLVYIDDSGNDKVRCFSAIVLHENVWKVAQNTIREFRRSLKSSDRMFVTKELHATDFTAGRGNIGRATVSKWRRNEIFRETLLMISKLPEVRLLNCVSTKANERLVFERLINRVNTAMSKWQSNALIIHDEGKDYTSLVRRLCVYNPIRSKYGAWPGGKEFKNLPTERIIEDIVFRKSHESDFIQMADFCAYALFRSEVPLASRAKYSLETAFKILHPVCIKAAYANDPKNLGIIRCP